MKIVFISVVIFLACCLLLMYNQRKLMYFPVTTKPDLREVAADMTEIELYTKDGLTLVSWYKAPENGNPTLLYLHGNAGSIANRVPNVRHFLDKGIGVLLLEYRGYGGNKGSPTEQGLYEDGRAALHFLQQQSIASSQIVLYGESLGTGVAIQLASENKVCAVVLQSPYTSFVDLARFHYPWALFKPFDRYETIKKIDKINAPLLVMHGKLDTVVPFIQGQEVFRAAKEPKTFIEFKQSNHNDLWSTTTLPMDVNNFINVFCKK